MGTAEGGATILMADDSRNDHRLVQEILEPLGHRVVSAFRGDEALELVKKENPEVILLDVMMPGIDGFEVCRTLKADPQTASIPVIFLTALGDREDTVRGLRAGAVDYLAKPFSPAELTVRIETHLALKRAREAQARLIEDLRKALGQVRRLSGLIPICANCKRVRDDEGYWQQVEAYVAEHSEATFTHGICPECLATLYPQYAEGGDGAEEPQKDPRAV